MTRLAALAAMVVVLGGCDNPGGLRNSTAQQVEDFATCKAGGMAPYRTVYGEIKCTPPVQGEQP